MAALFRARIVNLIGHGEQVTGRKNGWSRDKFCFTLDEHNVTIKQRKTVLNLHGSDVRGRQIASSIITVTKAPSFEDGIALIEDLCWLLSFATQSSVAAYEFSMGKRKTFRPVSGVFNRWRPPFGSGVGKLSDFITQTWPNYRRFSGLRPISAFIHMIDASDISDGVLESKITASMQCLESIKSYFALTEGPQFGIREDKSGRFVDARGRESNFETLLTLTLQEVGMSLPPSFDKIKKLRNALIHRGFIRETDNVTRYIFGQLSGGAMHNAMFEVMEEVQDVLREYLLRLLGYRGQYWAYSNSGRTCKTIN
jgi:hypothetical protein